MSQSRMHKISGSKPYQLAAYILLLTCLRKVLESNLQDTNWRECLTQIKIIYKAIRHSLLFLLIWLITSTLKIVCSIQCWSIICSKIRLSNLKIVMILWITSLRFTRTESKFCRKESPREWSNVNIRWWELVSKNQTKQL